MVEFNWMKWTCSGCGKKHRVRKVYKDGEYHKTCSCGRTMIVKVKMEEETRLVARIIGLRDANTYEKKLKKWQEKM
jgi:hypothetical protein